MAEHFKYYPSNEAVVTPWNARYSYPSEANKARKMTPRIPPKNGQSFNPGNIVRIEFPAQGYVNPANTHLEMDVVLYGPIVSLGGYIVRFQNNIQSIFSRVRLLYGSSSLEDMVEYGLIVRSLTEWTAGSQTHSLDRSSVTDGIGGCIPAPELVSFGPALSLATNITTAIAGNLVTFTDGVGTSFSGVTAGDWVKIEGLTGQTNGTYNGVFQVTAVSVSGDSVTVYNETQVAGAPVFTAGEMYGTTPATTTKNTRQYMIQGIQGVKSGLRPLTTGCVPNGASTANLPSGCPQPLAGQQFSVRRYMVNFALGLFTQDKLLPTRYMASQLAIELTLATSESCIYQPLGFAYNTTPPSYAVGNINLIPEIIEFDDTYDAQFLAGLEANGIPLKYSTWHYFQFSTQGSSSLQLQISERSRSVKGIFAVQRRAPTSFEFDSHACFYDSYSISSYTTGSTLQSYQYRIGGVYHPGSPVQNSLTVGGSISNGGVESYIELEKFLNIVGRYDIAANVSPLSWGVPASLGSGGYLPEYDYSFACLGTNSFGQAKLINAEALFGKSGNMPSSCFAAAINFETTNGVEISGLNAEEQSDISFNVKWSNAQSSGFSIEVFTYVDVMLVIRPNNYVDIVQ